jgi:hypothetical protein
MPGDPQECRRHAFTCARLAQTSPHPESRENFANLAQTWLRLASDLERNQALLAALKDDEQELIRTG